MLLLVPAGRQRVAVASSVLSFHLFPPVSLQMATGGGLEGSPLSPLLGGVWCNCRNSRQLLLSFCCPGRGTQQAPLGCGVRVGRAVTGGRCGALQPRGQHGGGVACGAWHMGVAGGPLRHPELARRSAGRAAAGSECSGQRAPCGAAGRRGRERYCAVTVSFGCWESSGIALGDTGRGRRWQGPRSFAGLPAPPGALGWRRACVGVHALQNPATARARPVSTVVGSAAGSAGLQGLLRRLSGSGFPHSPRALKCGASCRFGELEGRGTVLVTQKELDFVKLAKNVPPPHPRSALRGFTWW